MDLIRNANMILGANQTTNGTSTGSNSSTTGPSTSTTNTTNVFTNSAVLPFWSFLTEDSLIYYRSVILLMMAGLGYLNFKLVATKQLSYCKHL